MEYLPPEDMAVIVEALGQNPHPTAAELARRLERPYFTVAKAVQRVRHHGWATALEWRACTECGQAVLSRRGAGHRTVHPGCERARTARYGRERRKKKPGQSTPYVRRWRAEHPAELAAMRARERERAPDRWLDLPPEQQAEMLSKLHAADARDYPVTLELAENRGDAWTSDEDQYVLDHLDTPAREVALDLGRTLWAVRHRRVVLRRRLGIPVRPN